MREIPKEILDRCEFKNTKQDSTLYLTRIKPIAPCPCGQELDDTRRVRLAKTKEPVPHWREYCQTCRRVSIRGENNWMPPRELNAIMRKADFRKG